MNKTQWLDEALWQRLNAPTSEGSTLPNAAYIDPEFFQEEREWVFKKNWVFAEFAHKLAETGTVHPVQVAGQSLLLTKDTDG
ncbi:MAG: aromatic ring-hydroxylating dioxygenase subunit alpha, partial [Pseudomonadota bacterium]